MHRACADLYAVYLLNMYRRKQIYRRWAALSFAYDKVIQSFAGMLLKNARLKPMVDSVAAQF